MIRQKLSFLVCIGTWFALNSCGPSLPEEIKLAQASLPNDLDYNIHVKPILSDKCFACHGPDKAKQKAGLRLDLADFAYGELPESPGKVAIKPGSLNSSEFFHRIISADPDYQMPTPESHLSLTAYEKAVLIKWIDDGAEYKPHWAFVKPEQPKVPKVAEDDKVQNEIDNFVFKKLETKGLTPSAKADKETLLRRVSFDLTGLPPSLSEIENFKKDSSPKAFEKVVDRLLATPQYGEQMAVDWLDLARFADTHGYTVDRERDMSPYRDFVINAFNKNMPYDTFMHWQLAGDLMPKPTKEMLIATAFNRNHQQNMEGGIIEEEFQSEYVVDRTNTLGDAFLGLTVGCAKCHDHKYDPISQKNYFELYSFFNNVKEAGQISWDDAMPSPTMLLPNKEQAAVIQFINTKLSTSERNLTALVAKGQPKFEQWLSANQHKVVSRQRVLQKGLVGKYGFEKNSLNNEQNKKHMGYFTSDAGGKEKPNFTDSPYGKGLLLDGDNWLDCGGVGVFSKADPFTVSIAVNLPKELNEGVIFHKSKSERLFNFRGFHLYLTKTGALEAGISHVAPSNAITKLSKIKMPRNQWATLTMTYDGSGKAQGLSVYLNGKKMDMLTTMDQLTKDILFDKTKFKVQPGLQVGAWGRGSGLKNAKVDELLVFDRSLSSLEVGLLANDKSTAPVAQKTVNTLSPSEKNLLKEYYFTSVYEPVLAAQKQLQTHRQVLADSTEHISELMIMQEMPTPRQTFLLKRGNYDSPGEKVFPNTPESILPWPKKLPKNRYGLAQWLTHKDNPLTARVAVNRYWKNLFGTGLVKTAEDFGNQGSMPSHPQLLDHLAIKFMASGWDVKKLMKEMVMSYTYQQSSVPSKELQTKDPDNVLLARGPAQRLSAEMIRDNALVASGLLVKTLGGKSVKPYQPDGLWKINGAAYVPDSNESVYRRSVYVVVKRTVPHPTLATFDGNARSTCQIRRQNTNTPLQALVTLNDPTFVEASKVMGEKMARISDPRLAIIQAYQQLTGKLPKPQEIALLLKAKDQQKQVFKQKPEKRKGWLSAGYYKIDSSLSAEDVAANAVVASLIMNSDATLTKR
jgi:hypothetical protein